MPFCCWFTYLLYMRWSFSHSSYKDSAVHIHESHCHYQYILGESLSAAAACNNSGTWQFTGPRGTGPNCMRVRGRVRNGNKLHLWLWRTLATAVHNYGDPWLWRTVIANCGPSHYYITNSEANSEFHPFQVGKLRTNLSGWSAGVWGAFTCVGWQVTLPDYIGQVTLRTSETGCPWTT